MALLYNKPILEQLNQNEFYTWIFHPEQLGCKELDALTPKERKKELKHHSPREICHRLFFETRKIGNPAKVLETKKFKEYKENLAKDECLQAEQILWHHYKTTYPTAPKIDLSKSYDHTRGNWRFFVLARQVPDVYFCMKKTRFEAAQKEIQNQNIPTSPITDLYKIYKIKSKSHIEDRRNGNLRLIIALMREDYAPAQIYIIRQSMKGDIFTLTPPQHYRLLKRLKMLGNLPENLKEEFIKAKQQITQEEAEKIDKKLASYSFFLIISMPTMAKKDD